MKFSQILHRWCPAGPIRHLLLSLSVMMLSSVRAEGHVWVSRWTVMAIVIICSPPTAPSHLCQKKSSGLFILNVPLLRPECAKVPKSGHYGPTCLSSVPRDPGGVSSVCKRSPDSKDEARACRLGVLVPGLRCWGGGLDLAIPGRRATPDVFDIGVL